MNTSSTRTAQAIQLDRAPGLDCLLIDATTLKDPARAELAATNVLLPVTAGIRAIGDLLTDAAGSTGDPISTDTLQEIGYLLAFLADFQGALRSIIECAHYELLRTHATTLHRAPRAPICGGMIHITEETQP